MTKYVDVHEFPIRNNQVYQAAKFMRQYGFDPIDYGGSIKATIAAYNADILAKYNPDTLGPIRYLRDGRIHRHALLRKVDTWKNRRRLRAERFHARFYIHAKGRYPHQHHNYEYFHAFIDPDTGARRRGSILASSQTLMRRALDRYGREHLDGADPLQILLMQMFQEALEGDRFARAEILCRVLPPPKDATLQLVEDFDPSTMDAADLMKALVGELAKGQISPSDARTAIGPLEALFRTESFQKLEQRLEAVERSRMITSEAASQSRAAAEGSGLLIEAEAESDDG